MANINVKCTFESLNELLYLIRCDTGAGKHNSLTITGFIFDQDKEEFIYTSFIDSLNIAPYTVCSAVVRYDDLTSDTTKLGIILLDTIRGEFAIFQLTDGRLEKIGVFSETVILRRVADHDNICTQAYTTDECQASGVDVKVDRTLILDGPTVVLISGNELYFSFLSPRDNTQINSVAFKRTKLHTRDCSLMWIGVCGDYIIALGSFAKSHKCEKLTGEQKSTDTNKRLHQNPSCMYKKARQDSDDERTFIAFRVKLFPAKVSRVTSDNECEVEYLPSKAFIPDIYSNITTCVTVKYCQQADRAVTDANKTESAFYHSEVFACTTLKQVLFFKNGRVINCTEIPTDCVAKISQFETFCGESYIVIWSTKRKVILVKEESFQVVQVIDEVSTFLINDFVANGAEQLLLLLTSKQEEDICVNEPADPGQYVLTDLEGVHIERRMKKAARKISDIPCAQSVHATFEALKMRRQMVFQSLFETEKLSKLKQDVIQQTYDALRTVDVGESSSRRLKPLNSVVQLLNTGQAQGTVTSQVNGHHGISVTNVCHTTTSEVKAGVQVLDMWYRTMNPGYLVVGLKVQNLTGSQMENIHIVLVDEGVSSSFQTNSTFHTKSVIISDPKHTSLSADTPPPSKIIKALPVYSIEETNHLPQSETSYVLAVTGCPMFDTGSTKTYILWLMWAANDKPRRTLSHFCGTLCLTVDEIYAGRYSLNVKDVMMSADGDLQSVVCFLVTQRTWTLYLRCLCSDLSYHIYKALDALDFKFVSHWQCYMCYNNGSLQYVTVRVLPSDKHTLYIDVSIRNDDQLIFFTHVLYANLPDDVIIKLSNQKLLPGSIHTAIQCLFTELTLSKGQLTQMLHKAAAENNQQSIVSGDNVSLQSSFEGQRKDINRRESSLLDNEELKHFLERWKQAWQTTDDSVQNLISMIHI